MKNLLSKIFINDYEKTDDPLVRKKYGFVASLFGLITNLILFISKITIGLITSIYSIVTDSINNLSDFGNNLLAIFGVKVSAKPADKEHPYGHQRMEYVMSLIIGFVIIFLGLIMVYNGVNSLIEFIKSMIDTGRPVTKELDIKSFIITTIILSIAILIKCAQVYVYGDFSKQIKSLQLKALSKDAFNDVLDTSFVLIGLVISYIFKIDIDCFFVIFVSILVIKSGFGIIKEAINELIGMKPDSQLINKITSLLFDKEEVLGVHDLELHSYGKVWYGSISVEVSSSMNLVDAHTLVDQIEREELYKNGVHLSIHIDPIDLNDAVTKNIKNCLLDIIKENNYPVSIHDLHIDKNQYITVYFDLVLNTILTIEDKVCLETSIIDRLKENYGQSIRLVVKYEDINTDLLDSSQAK